MAWHKFIALLVLNTRNRATKRPNLTDKSFHIENTARQLPHLFCGKSKYKAHDQSGFSFLPYALSTLIQEYANANPGY